MINNNGSIGPTSTKGIMYINGSGQRDCINFESGKLLIGQSDGLPSSMANGTDGYVLGMSGGVITWIENAPTAAGSDTQILYNDGGSIAGLASFTLQKSNGMVGAKFLTVQPAGTAGTAITARRGTAGQTEPVIQVQDQSNNLLASVTHTGSFTATLVNAEDDAAAATAGVDVGEFYRNGSVVMIRVA